MKTPPLDQAIALAGGLQALADKLGITRQRLGNWRARKIPVGWCWPIEQATGVPCEKLRPDLEWFTAEDVQ